MIFKTEKRHHGCNTVKLISMCSQILIWWCTFEALISHKFLFQPMVLSLVHLLQYSINKMAHHCWLQLSWQQWQWQLLENWCHSLLCRQKQQIAWTPVIIFCDLFFLFYIFFSTLSHHDYLLVIYCESIINNSNDSFSRTCCHHWLWQHFLFVLCGFNDCGTCCSDWVDFL